MRSGGFSTRRSPGSTSAGDENTTVDAVASAAGLDPGRDRPVAETLATMVAAAVEVSLDPLLAGDDVPAPDAIERALDRFLVPR